MKKLLVILIALILMTPLAVCGAAPSSYAAESKQYIVGLAMHDQTADWSVSFKDTFLAAAEAKGCEVAWNDANFVASRQVDNIEDLVTQGIDILVVLPADYTALGQALKYVQDAGIPIVNADSKVTEEDFGYITAFVTADSYDSGQALGKYFVSSGVLPEGAIVGEFTLPHMQHVTERFDGLEAYFTDNGREDIVIVEKAVTDQNAIAAYTEDMLMANPDIAAIVCFNDNAALTCYATCVQLGRADCLVTGYDGSPAAKQSIKAGEMYATMVYSPVDLAASSFASAYSQLTSGDVSNDYKVPMWMINRENIDDYDLEHWE